MNLLHLEVIVALGSVISSFYLVLQYLLRFQRRIDRILILLSINSERIQHVERFLGKTSEFHCNHQISEEFLPEPDTDVL